VGSLNKVARYGGGAWSALANCGLNFSVYSLAVSGTDLYVGGGFTEAADGIVVDLNHIARYSAGAWSALPNYGLEDSVTALAVSGTDLCVGGFFNRTVDSSLTTLNYVAKLSSAPSGPTITSITSRTGKPGSTVTIKGAGFSSTASRNTAYFGTKKARISRAKTTSLKGTIPRVPKGNLYVYVVVSGQPSNKVLFQVK